MPNFYLKKMLELNSADLTKKVKISPIGEVVGFDGRAFKIDANKVIEATKENEIDLVVDIDHGYGGYGDKAGGWIDLNSLEIKEDGIYATINYTDIGKELLEKKYYKYLSPAYIVDSNRNVSSIDSVGIVNRPNLLKDKLVNKKENTNKEEQMPEETKELNKKIDDFKKEINAKDKEIKALNTQIKMQKIDNAIASGELMPNKRNFALDLNDQQLDDFLNLNKSENEDLKKEIKQDKKEDNKKISDEQKEVNKQLGLDEEGKK